MEKRRCIVVALGLSILANTNQIRDVHRIVRLFFILDIILEGKCGYKRNLCIGCSPRHLLPQIQGVAQ